MVRRCDRRSWAPSFPPAATTCRQIPPKFVEHCWWLAPKRPLALLKGRLLVTLLQSGDLGSDDPRVGSSGCWMRLDQTAGGATAATPSFPFAIFVATLPLSIHVALPSPSVLPVPLAPRGFSKSLTASTSRSHADIAFESPVEGRLHKSSAHRVHLSVSMRLPLADVAGPNVRILGLSALLDRAATPPRFELPAFLEPSPADSSSLSRPLASADGTIPPAFVVARPLPTPPAPTLGAMRP